MCKDLLNDLEEIQDPSAKAVFEKLIEIIRKNPPTPKGKFQPHARYNEDGNQLEVYWDDEEAYTEEAPNHSMAIHYGMESKKIVGVTVYNIKQLIKESNDG